jgi:hypothetical protein
MLRDTGNFGPPRAKRPRDGGPCIRCHHAEDATRPENARGFMDERRRVADMLEQVQHRDRVDRILGKLEPRKCRSPNIDAHDGARVVDGPLIHVDSRGCPAPSTGYLDQESRARANVDQRSGPDELLDARQDRGELLLAVRTVGEVIAITVERIVALSERGVNVVARSCVESRRLPGASHHKRRARTTADDLESTNDKRGRKISATRRAVGRLRGAGVRQVRSQDGEDSLSRMRAAKKLISAEAGVVAALAVWIMFALNFGDYKVVGDGLDYFSFDQRLFGDRPSGSGYNFGTGLLNAPFYGAAKIADSLRHVAAGGVGLPEASITLASITYIASAAVISTLLLRRLELGFRGWAIAAAIFGTPIWYYGSFSPSYTHAADAAVFAAGAWCLWHLVAERTLTWAVAFGAVLGLATTVRPFNAACAVAAVLILAVQRRVRDAAATGVAAATTYGALLLIPLALGTGLRTRASGAIVAPDHVFGVAPLTPLRMLFSIHRGLYVWTPVTLLATAGFVLALLRARGSARTFLTILGGMALALLLVNVSLTWWDGGWSFSMRYLSSLLPVWAIGIAALLEALRGRARSVAAAAIVAATAWSLFLGMNHAFGGASLHSSAWDVARLRGPESFLHKTWSYSRIRHVTQRL